MNWKKMLEKAKVRGDESVIARYWYVIGHGRGDMDPMSAYVLKHDGTTEPYPEVMSPTKQMVRAFFRSVAKKCHSVRELRAAKRLMLGGHGFAKAKAVLVTVRRVSKGGPKTVPSQKLPSTFPHCG